MTIRLGINGFGRIGRLAARISKDRDIEIAGVNDLTDAKTLAHLFKYDSVHGKYEGEVSADGDAIIIDGKKIKVTAEKDPSKLNWDNLDVDVVLESTGVFRTRELAQKHIDSGAKKVVLSAPAKDAIDATIVLGVNEDIYEKDKHHIISNASCTTNCIAPVAKVLLDEFGLERGVMTTIHAYTNDQKILDLPHKDLRRARAAGLSMIPTTTGAAKAVGIVIPELKGKLDGMAIRVPTPDVSVVDFAAVLGREVSVDELNSAFQKASETERFKGILGYAETPLVSIDYTGCSYSSVYESNSVFVQGNLVKVLAWYDNEFGYSSRIVDLIEYIMK
ncbi:MAG: type I glyceraldehyde-3-phosphate dehydrogenase [bacterium]